MPQEGLLHHAKGAVLQENADHAVVGNGPDVLQKVTAGGARPGLKHPLFFIEDDLAEHVLILLSQRFASTSEVVKNGMKIVVCQVAVGIGAPAQCQGIGDLDFPVTAHAHEMLGKDIQ